jgi:hypothetical protein
MDSLWSDVFVWDSPPEEELLGLLQPSEEWLGLDSQFPSLPPPWLDWELGCNDTSTLLEDGLPNYLQGEHYEGIDDASAEHDPFTAALFHSRATHPTSSDEPQIVTTLASQTQFTDCLHEFEGMPNRTAPRRRRKRFDPMRRKEVDQLRKVGACIRCRLTKTPVSLAGHNILKLQLSCASVNWIDLVQPVSRRAATLSLAKPSATGRECSTFDLLQVKDAECYFESLLKL